MFSFLFHPRTCVQPDISYGMEVFQKVSKVNVATSISRCWKKTSSFYICLETVSSKLSNFVNVYFQKQYWACVPPGIDCVDKNGVFHLENTCPNNDHTRLVRKKIKPGRFRVVYGRRLGRTNGIRKAWRTLAKCGLQFLCGISLAIVYANWP